MTNNLDISDGRLPFWWQVTKYDPALRDARGAFPAVAWTSVADVGRAFGGTVLSTEEYERVETRYVDGFVAFAGASGVSTVAVRGLENGDVLREDDLMTVESARATVRRMLREEVICRLEAPDGRFALHIGFDLYMYIGSWATCEPAVQRCEELGLFVEPVAASPLWPED